MEKENEEISEEDCEKVDEVEDDEDEDEDEDENEDENGDEEENEYDQEEDIEQNESNREHSQQSQFESNSHQSDADTHRDLRELFELQTYDIFSLARHGKYIELEALLLKGINPDSKDEQGNTVLIIGAQNGNKRIAKLALRYGAQINMANSMGNTSLHFAFEYQYKDLYEYLIQKGANPYCKNIRGIQARDGIRKKDKNNDLKLTSTVGLATQNKGRRRNNFNMSTGRLRQSGTNNFTSNDQFATKEYFNKLQAIKKKIV